jgi:hypothetical protein
MVAVSNNPTVMRTNIGVITFSDGSGANIAVDGTAAVPPPRNLLSHVLGA